MISEIKQNLRTMITDFSDWLSPWYPIQIKESVMWDNDLNFEKEAGLRFVPKWKKLLNQNLPRILSYGKREYLRRYDKEVDQWSIMNDFEDGYVGFTAHNYEIHEHLSLEFWYGVNRIKSIKSDRDVVYAIRYRPEVNMRADDMYLKDDFGRNCLVCVTYFTESTDYLTFSHCE